MLEFWTNSENNRKQQRMPAMKVDACHKELHATNFVLPILLLTTKPYPVQPSSTFAKAHPSPLKAALANKHRCHLQLQLESLQDAIGPTPTNNQVLRFFPLGHLRQHRGHAWGPEKCFWSHGPSARVPCGASGEYTSGVGFRHL